MLGKSDTLHTRQFAQSRSQKKLYHGKRRNPLPGKEDAQQKLNGSRGKPRRTASKSGP